MTTTIDSRTARIPTTLQSVFLNSNRGNEIHKPPPEQVANKVFGNRMRGFWKRTRSTRKLFSTNQPEQKKESKTKTNGAKIVPCLKESKPAPTKELSPQMFLESLIRTRGYSTKRYKTLECAYHSKPTDLQKASHSVHLIQLIRNGDAPSLRRILSSGVSPNPCNEFGESLLHMVARRGDHDLLKVFMDCNSSVQVADDYGRTPLHDACWASEPAFETVKIILKRDPHLILMTDSRGAVPLTYVSKDHWPAWVKFLEEHQDEFWPKRDLLKDGEQAPPPLTLLKPGQRPLPGPANELSPELATSVATGRMSPEEAQLLMRCDELSLDDFSDTSYDSDEDDFDESFCSRATFDEDEMAGLLSNLACSSHLAKPVPWTR